MRNPDRVKNTETPRNPPRTAGIPAWKQNTATTASPRIPSSAGTDRRRGSWWVIRNAPSEVG